jgi:3-oxoacyl-[acyl-carrier protein] reductase
MSPEKDLCLEGKVAIVTGSSRGIGRAIALNLGEHGANIVINSTEKSIPQAQVVKSEIEKNGQKAIIITGDVSKKQTAIEIVLKTIEEFKHIDILVNNAGTTKDGLLIRMSQEQWQGVIDTNLNGTFYMTHEVTKQMFRQKTPGSIISISSMVAQVGNPGQANYAASKAGVDAATRCWAQEYKERGIRFNALALGFVETELVKDVTEKQKEEILKKTSRFISKEEVAEKVLFLASDKSSGITGRIINLDGGTKQ